MSNLNYYQILEVEKNATQDEIKKAFRKQTMKWHPDRNPGDNTAEDKFKAAAIAYETLGDEKKRKSYDMSLLTGGGTANPLFDPRSAQEFVTIFNSFFDQVDAYYGTNFKQPKKSKPRRRRSTTRANVGSCPACGGKRFLNMRQGDSVIRIACPKCKKM